MPHRSYSSVVEEVRNKCRFTPVETMTFFSRVLNAFVLPIEAAFHTRIGYDYISYPQTLLAAILLWSSGHILNIDFEMRSFNDIIHEGSAQYDHLRATTDAISQYPALNWLYHTGLVPIDLRSAQENSDNDILNLVLNYRAFPVVIRHHQAKVSFEHDDHLIFSVEKISGAVGIFLFFITIHRIRNFIWARRGEQLHNVYNGEPWSLWNPIYYLGAILHFNVDLVKLFVEPSICISLGIFIAVYIQNRPEFGESWLLYARW